MGRPTADFVNNDRSRLKPHRQANPFLPITPDIDNFVKFIMDVLSGIVYHDDKQVVSVRAWKLRDNKGECYGRSTVKLYKFDPSRHYVSE